jgi:hypothetical protein
MRGVLKRMAHTWATILVAYALLLNGLVPLGAIAPQTGSGIICTTTSDPSAADDRTGRPDDTGHRALCCILCGAAASATLPDPAIVPAASAAGREVKVAVFSDQSQLPAPRRARPQNPRAPPTRA